MSRSDYEKAREDAAVDNWIKNTDHYYKQLSERHPCVTTQEAFKAGYDAGYESAFAEAKKVRENLVHIDEHGVVTAPFREKELAEARAEIERLKLKLTDYAYEIEHLDHLYVGILVDNVRDMIRRGRSTQKNQTHCKREESQSKWVTLELLRAFLTTNPERR